MIVVYSFDTFSQVQDKSIPSKSNSVGVENDDLDCLNFKQVNRDLFIKKLAVEFDVHIKSDIANIFDISFLSYLYAYFELMNPIGPIFLNSSNEEGPHLVKYNDENKDGTDLTFSNNAARKLENRKFKEIVDAYNKTQGLIETKDVTLIFDFNNELFNQLNKVLLSKEALAQLLEREVGIKMEALDDDPEKKYSGDFTERELATLVKQFIDLPPQVRKNLALERIVRMQGGYELEGGANANYNIKSKVIKLTDAAFKKNNSSIERRFIHELGHAFWYNMPKELQDDFIKLSWEENADGSWKIKPGASNFVSWYSVGGEDGTDYEEDFAESFAFYVNNREALETKAPDKFKWLKDNIFLNTEYYTDAAENVKQFVPSKCEDLKAPVFDNLTAKTFKISCIYKENNTAEITWEVRGVHDDLSGVKKIYLSIDGEKRHCSVFLGEEDCIDKERGIYKKTTKENLENLAPDDYALANMNLEDKAGNDKWFSPPDNFKPIHLDGKMVEKVQTYVAYDKNSIIADSRIETKELADGTTVMSFKVPFKHIKNLFSFTVFLEGKETGKRIMISAGPGELLSKPGEDNTMFSLAIPLETQKDRFRVNSYSISIAKWNKNGYPSPDRSIDIEFPNSSNLYVNHNGKSSDKTMPTVLANQVELEVIEGMNSKGGTKSIVATIPVSGIDSNKSKISIYFRTPTGKYLNLFHLDEEKYARIDKSGVRYYTCIMPLPPNHEEGDYIFSEIEVIEKYSRPSGLPKNVSYPMFAENKIKERFMQRAIVKTVKVKNKSSSDPELKPIIIGL